MRSHAVVIVRIVFQNPTQMFLVQDNDVVQTLAPDRSDQPFGKAVLPRRGRCNWLVSDAHGTQSARDHSAVDSISISDHIARCAIPRKSLGDLTCNPLRRRVGCDADPDEISAIKRHTGQRASPDAGNLSAATSLMCYRYLGEPTTWAVGWSASVACRYHLCRTGKGASRCLIMATSLQAISAGFAPPHAGKSCRQSFAYQSSRMWQR